jgi:putative transposase
MAQQARNLCIYWQEHDFEVTDFIHDADTKFTTQFDGILESEGARPHQLMPRSPNLNAYAERWVQSIKHECLNHFIVLGEAHLCYLVEQYLDHYHSERPHQARDNVPLCGASPTQSDGTVICRERLGRPIRHCIRQAA